MNCQAPTSLRRIAERLSHYFMSGDSYNYSSPLHLLSIYSRMEQLNQTPDLRARPGSLLLLRVLQTEEDCMVTLTSPADANPEQQRISVLSPMGASLLGMSQGDTCRVYFMGSTLNLKLLRIIG